MFILAFLKDTATHFGLVVVWVVLAIVATALAIKWAKPGTIVGKIAADIPPKP